MTPKLGRVSTVKVKQCSNTRCPDTGASRVLVHRHHTGCDKMWVRHLLDAKPHEPWVQKLALRYDQFHPDDIVELCVMCHDEIHKRYEPLIKRMTYFSGRSIGSMTETEVARNTKFLRDVCKDLLKNGFTVRKSIIDDYYGKKSKSTRTKRR